MTTIARAAWDMAERAADRIVGRRADPSVARGVLAQWIAENGWQWPPPRNNPGNVARGWAAGLGIPFSIHFPNPQPGNPIVTFATAAQGADCYAAGLVRYSRYAAAVTRARAGDGLGFAVDVCRAGYGTGERTTRAVYAALTPPAQPGPAPAPGGVDVAIRYAGGVTSGHRMRLGAGTVFYDRPGGHAATRTAGGGLFPHVGLAASVAGAAWRAVIVGTRWSYSDGVVRPTILYVPASAGEVI